jgi:putative transcriptional regulator
VLIATPPLVDPHFDRSVVLVLAHDDEGALGLVLNRPTQESVAPGLRAWLDLADEPAVIFSGGPVDTDALIGLAAVTAIDLARDDALTDDDGWSPLDDGLATVDLEFDPDELDVDLRHVRLFRGYAGWGPGQLDDEVEEGAWIVVDPRSDDPFTSRPDDLWRAVLRRQPGRLAWLANCPDDIASN